MVVPKNNNRVGQNKIYFQSISHLNVKPVIMNYGLKIISKICWRKVILHSVSGPDFLERGMTTFESLL